LLPSFPFEIRGMLVPQERSVLREGREGGREEGREGG